jgi:hypothetical protein
MLGIKPRALHMLDKCFTTELHPNFYINNTPHRPLCIFLFLPNTVETSLFGATRSQLAPSAAVGCHTFLDCL